MRFKPPIFTRRPRAAAAALCLDIHTKYAAPLARVGLGHIPNMAQSANVAHITYCARGETK
jgi:hypothetical protein